MLRWLFGKKTETVPKTADAPATFIAKWDEIDEPSTFANAHKVMEQLLLPEGSEYFLLHDKHTIKLYTSATVDEVRDFVAEQLGYTDATANSDKQRVRPYCWVDLKAPYKVDGEYNSLCHWCIEVAAPRLPFPFPS